MLVIRVPDVVAERGARPCYIISLLLETRPQCTSSGRASSISATQNMLPSLFVGTTNQLFTMQLEDLPSAAEIRAATTRLRATESLKKVFTVRGNLRSSMESL
jgi:hypothetical protein